MSDSKTLAQWLDQGPLPVSEALRLARLLSETLRRMHDRGLVHGAVTPANLTITATGILLAVPTPEELCQVTPYSAPEVIAGCQADARADIFAFGAIVFEMLTGRRAFPGESRAEPPSSGSPAVDRLVLPCLAGDPNVRPPRMQNVILELKLLTATARRAAAAAATRADAASLIALRNEMREMERRLALPFSERLDAHEDAISKLQCTVTEALAILNAQLARAATEPQQAAPTAAEADTLNALRNEMRELERRLDLPFTDRLEAHEDAIADLKRKFTEALAILNARLAAAVTEPPPAPPPQTARDAGRFEDASARIHAFVERSFERVSERVAAVEQSLEALKLHHHEFEHTVAADLVDFEEGLKTQITALHAARTAMSQTDDLVERVVDAIESLQSAVLDPAEPADRSSYSAN